MTKVSRFKIPPFFFTDWGIRLLLWIPAGLWAHGAYALFPQQPDYLLAAMLAIFCGLVGFLSMLFAWKLYTEFVADRYYLSPWRFLAWYGSILTFTLIVDWISPILAALLLLLFMLPGYVAWRVIRPRLPQKWAHSTAQALVSYGKAKRLINRHLAKDDPGLYHGGLRLPTTAAVHNILYAGSINAGKSIQMRLLMQSFLPRIQPGKGYRSAVYDFKTELLPLIQQLAQNARIFITNPFDRRHYAWDTAKDVLTPGHARELADSYAPQTEGQGENSFWIKACHYILEGVVTRFLLAGQNWTQRDIILACRSKERLYAILDSHPQTQRFLELLRGDKLTHSVMVTIHVYLSQFAVIAALNEQARAEGRTFSIKQWAEEDAILLLGFSSEYEIAFGSINRLLLQRVFATLEARPGERALDSLLFLDEFPTLGAIPRYTTFTATVRSKGAGQVIAFQAYPQLVATYGAAGAATITGQFSHRAYLRLNDAQSTAWVSNEVGNGERYRRYYQGKKIIESDSVEWAKVVQPEDLARIAPPNKATKQGITGFYTAGQYSYWHYCSSRYLQEHLVEPDPSIRAFEPMDHCHQFLEPWGYEDLVRLNLDRHISLEEHQHHVQEEQSLLQNIPSQFEDIRKRLNNLGVFGGQGTTDDRPQTDEGYTTEENKVDVEP